MPLPPPGEVEIWTVELDRPSDAGVGALGGVLTADELLRAGAIATEQGRRRAVVTRAALRLLLARYLGQPPEQIAFAAGAQGKPRLEQRDHPLRFNLSHSDELALIAVAHGAEVGVDVERVRPRHDLAGIARRTFAEAEREAVQAAPPEQRERAFYRHWVAKEAFVKATGRSVASLRSFEVLLEAPGGARIVHVGGDREAARGWTLEPLDPGRPAYVAALVAEAGATIATPAPFDPDPLAPR